jgi:hypothetical protein
LGTVASQGDNLALAFFHRTVTVGAVDNRSTNIDHFAGVAHESGFDAPAIGENPATVAIFFQR